MKLFLIGVTVALVVLPARADEDKARYLTNGYSLLYKLCDDEKPVDMILMIKTTPKEIADYLHAVSKASAADLDQLERLRDEDRSIHFGREGLPPFEQDTRGSIRDDKQHMLLFGTKDAAFVRTMLVAQIEAGTYGLNLAKVLADAEPNPQRAAVVRKIGASWQKLRDRAYALLNAS